jgi:hypothetical protein
MIYKNSKIDYDRLVSLLWQKGLTPAKFNSNYRKKTGSNEQILDRLKIGRDIKLSSAVNICIYTPPEAMRPVEELKHYDGVF